MFDFFWRKYTKAINKSANVVSDYYSFQSGKFNSIEDEHVRELAILTKVSDDFNYYLYNDSEEKMQAAYKCRRSMLATIRDGKRYGLSNVALDVIVTHMGLKGTYHYWLDYVTAELKNLGNDHSISIGRCYDESTLKEFFKIDSFEWNLNSI
jgi:hypothetical protein